MNRPEGEGSYPHMESVYDKLRATLVYSPGNFFRALLMTFAA